MKTTHISLKVITNSPKQKIEYKENIYKIYINSLPYKGKANKEVIKIISKKLKIPKQNIEIIKGEKSKNKIIKILGVDKDEVKTFLH